MRFEKASGFEIGILHASGHLITHLHKFKRSAGLQATDTKHSNPVDMYTEIKKPYDRYCKMSWQQRTETVFSV